MPEHDTTNRRSSLRALAPGRRFGRAEWLALGLALALHAVAFAVVPGPLNNALKKAPEILLSLNLEQPTAAGTINMVQSGVVAESGAAMDLAIDEPSEKQPGRVPQGTELGHYPTDRGDGRHGAADGPSIARPLPQPDRGAVQDRIATLVDPHRAESANEPDPAQVWAELPAALELRAAEGGPEDGETAPDQDAAAEPESLAAEQPAESPEPEQAADVDSEALLREYAAEIKALIEAEKFYPAAAERLGHSGTVKVGFTVNALGHVSGIYVKEASGYRTLDDAGMEAVRRAGGFPKIPPGLGRDSLALSVSLNYSLRQPVAP